MTLQVGFQFRQSRLQDYIDCQRRFQLRHMLHIAWPAVEAMPAIENEYFIHLGASFHYLVKQHQSGTVELRQHHSRLASDGGENLKTLAAEHPLNALSNVDVVIDYENGR